MGPAGDKDNMTRRWKLKTNSSNILLVLITLILVKAEWVGGSGSINDSTNSIDGENPSDQVNAYVGNDEIAEYFFGPSDNSSFILDGINKCLNNFQLITCMKMLLLSRINEAESLMEEPNFSQGDVPFLNGVFVFKMKNETNNSVPEEINDGLSLDEEIAAKVRKIMWRRSLWINLLPRIKIEIEPASGKSDFICFSYRVRNDLEFAGEDDEKTQGRKKKKGGGMSMMMMVPQLIMLGLMPFTLASLKAMVMNAVMINMMALNGAIFMTIRNLVFGPRQGDNVKYVNYGYSKNRQTQSKKPVLIIHSPAAFVKQPPVHKKQFHGQYSTNQITKNYGPENFSSSHPSQQNALHANAYEGNYYAAEEENYYKRQGQGTRRKTESLEGI